ncbi:MAG TPA: hypothetical protein CFH84_10030 [Sulfurimonas sp. UBA12504]|nr:MAG TPA: hypothetical protein CFH84_10030 [Sulfurimonas sp. UBA12504]
MKTEVETLLKAINMADMDGLKKVEADVSDLMLLRSVIRDQHAALQKQVKELHVLQARVNMKSMEKPVRLRMYA